jgi:hypothetical protein
MSEYTTVFGSLERFHKGTIDVIDDDPRNYVFSNLFEVARGAAAYERVAVAKNFEYVIEAMRAEGESPWYAAAHDEFVLCMDGEMEVVLVRVAGPPLVDPDAEGAVALPGLPEGRRMGRIVLRRGHMALLPGGAAYRFHAATPAVGLIQTLDGPVTQHRWADICLTK